MRNFSKDVNYLRHVISEKGVSPDQAKTNITEEYPPPRT
jgi:hypothetical protein